MTLLLHNTYTGHGALTMRYWEESENSANKQSLSQNRRRPRVKSVEEVEQKLAEMCSPSREFNGSHSVGNSLPMDSSIERIHSLRNRGSTEFSRDEEEDKHACNPCEESADAFDGNESIENQKCEKLFLRKSSYIVRNNNKKVGGLAKLLKETQTDVEDNDESVNSMDLEDNHQEKQVTLGFAFMKCIYCLQIFASERSREEYETKSMIDVRNRYCSGECHLTHLSALLQKQKMNQH